MKYGMQTIVIGGDKLSRGLTLEGLCVSYFLRSAKMPMYDTLMQMGRWFGYRQGYEDLCRLYTTRDVIEWFFHISVATDELRNLFRVMALQGATPKEFGLRVRDHPTLQITSKTKMRHARTERTCFSGGHTETVLFIRDKDQVKANFKLMEEFLKKLGKPKESNGIKRDFGNWKNSFQWINVDTANVINFLKRYKRFSSVRTYSTQMYADYIEKINRHGELTHFTVSLFGNGSSKIKKKISGIYNVELLLRHPVNNKEKNKISLKVITREKDEAVDLLEEELKEYFKSLDNLKKTRNKEEDKRDFQRMDRELIRFHRSEKRGLLNLYPIHGAITKAAFKKFNETGEIDKEHTAAYPLVGVSLSLPTSRLPSHQTNVDYQVNPVYSRLEWNE
jgi:hypothetical protein